MVIATKASLTRAAVRLDGTINQLSGGFLDQRMVLPPLILSSSAKNTEL
jgi:hypothetical protein